MRLLSAIRLLIAKLFGVVTTHRIVGHVSASGLFLFIHVGAAHEQPELLQLDCLLVVAVLHLLSNVDRMKFVLDVILDLGLHRVEHYDFHAGFDVKCTGVWFLWITFLDQVRWHSDLHSFEVELRIIVPELTHDFVDFGDEQVIARI